MKYILTLLLVVASATVFAQSATTEKETKEENAPTTASKEDWTLIAGIVTDAIDGFRIPGVNVLIWETTIGTVTDAYGRYMISVPDGPVVLIFSFIGYGTQAVLITSETYYDVKLNPYVLSLDDRMKR